MELQAVPLASPQAAVTHAKAGTAGSKWQEESPEEEEMWE